MEGGGRGRGGERRGEGGQVEGRGRGGGGGEEGEGKGGGGEGGGVEAEEKERMGGECDSSTLPCNTGGCMSSLPLTCHRNVRSSRKAGPVKKKHH